MAGRGRAGKPKISLGLGIALAVVLLGAATQLVDKLKAPLWVLVGLIVLGAVIAAVDVWRAQSASAQVALKDWAHRLESLLEAGPPIPRVKEMTPYGAMGVSPSGYSTERGRDRYVARDIDDRLRSALETKPFVVVRGEAKAGKSRTAYEAAADVLGERKLVIPRDVPNVLGELSSLNAPAEIEMPDGFDAPFSPHNEALVWLDDLERFLGNGMLGPALLERWQATGVKVVGTMRWEEPEPGANDQDRAAREGRRVLDRAHEIFLKTYLSNEEALEAAQLYPNETFDEVSIGAQLVSAKDLVRKFEMGHSAHPVGVALVQAAVDWRRAGGGREIAEAALKDIYQDYVDARMPVSESYDDGLAWACGPVESHVALLTAVQGSANAFRVFDHLVSYIERRDPRIASSIPDHTWRVLIRDLEAGAPMNLGFARYGRDSEVVKQFLSRSARALEAPVAEPDTGPPPNEMDRRLALASTLLERFSVTGSLADLDHAIDLLRQATGMVTYGAGLSMSLGQLGIALHRRYAATGDANDLDAAIAALSRLMSATPQTASEWPHTLGLLSSFMLERFDRTRDPSDLEWAIKGLQRALEDALPGSPVRPGVLRELAGSVRRRYVITLEEADLARSETAYREALAADLARTKTLYREAVEAEVEFSPSSAVGTAREWGDWMMERGNSSEAAEAYAAGLQAMLRAIRQQGLIPDKPTRIRAAEGLAARAAYAHVQTGEVERAAVALELDRALLLIDVLGEHPAALESLGAVDEQLLVEYRRLIAERTRLRNSLATRLSQISSTDSEDEVPLEESTLALRAELEEAGVELENVTASIRRSAGYSARIAPPSFTEIQAAANVPLVFLAAAGPGGVAVIIEADGGASPAAILLPDMNERNVTEQTTGLMGGSLRAADTGSILALSRWLWDAVMGAVLEAVAPAHRIILIPLGRLASLPLHAASTTDSMMPTGHRFALDSIAITYAPSARALVRPRGSQRSNSDHRFLVVAPSGNYAHLPGAVVEARAIAAVFPDAQVLLGEEATRSAVLDGLRRSTAFHFAGHGYASGDTPLSGGLLLARDDLLTVRDVLELDISGLELAVLSTGDVARPGRDHVGEMTLSSALMQAGVATVIAPQWPLSDDAASRIMSGFYKLLADGLKPLEALRQAQRAFRDEQAEGAEDWSWAALTCMGG